MYLIFEMHIKTGARNTIRIEGLVPCSTSLEPGYRKKKRRKQRKRGKNRGKNRGKRDHGGAGERI